MINLSAGAEALVNRPTYLDCWLAGQGLKTSKSPAKFEQQIDPLRVDIHIPPPLNQAAFCHVPEKPTELSFSTKRFLAYEKAQQERGEARPPRGENNRLVNTRKSPTQDKSFNNRVVLARFYQRSWSDEYRVRVESFTRLQQAPTPQQGDRWTDALTDNAARKIIDAGAFVAVKKGGFKTFLTLTLDSEARRRIQRIELIRGEPAIAGEYCNGSPSDGDFTRIDWDTISTIGREVSRFFDGLQKKYQRGWVWDASAREKAAALEGVFQSEFIAPEYVGVVHTDKGPQPVAKKLNYIWVAENPDVMGPDENHVGETLKIKTGENPHVHVLLDWEVAPHHFQGWAEQIEQLWGLGFGHLERIKKPEAACAYLLKALGYMTKGAQSVDVNTGELVNTQGRIRGNRYNISREARAPGWECIAEFEAERMAQIVAEVGSQAQHYQHVIKEELKAAREAEKHDIQQLAKMKMYKLPALVKARKLTLLETRLKHQQEAIKALEKTRQQSEFGGKYQVTFRNQSQLNAFVEKAVADRGWQAKVAEYVPAKSIKNAWSTWASKGLEIYKTVAAEAVNFERYWQQKLTDEYSDFLACVERKTFIHQPLAG